MAINRRKKTGNPVGCPKKKTRLQSVGKKSYRELNHKQRAARNSLHIHIFTSKKLLENISRKSENLQEYYNEQFRRRNNINLNFARRLDGERLMKDFQFLQIIKRKLNQNETFHRFIHLKEYAEEGVNCSYCEGKGDSRRHADTASMRSRRFSTRTFYFVLKGDVKFHIVLDTHSRNIKGEISDYDNIKTYNLKDGMGLIFPSKLQHWGSSKRLRKILVFAFEVKENTC